MYVNRFVNAIASLCFQQMLRHLTVAENPQWSKATTGATCLSHYWLMQMRRPVGKQVSRFCK